MVYNLSTYTAIFAYVCTWETVHPLTLECVGARTAPIDDITHMGYPVGASHSFVVNLTPVLPAMNLCHCL